MAVVSIPQGKSIKVTFDHGTNLDGDRIKKTRTYSSIKSMAEAQSILDFVVAIEGLQEHTRDSIVVEDKFSLQVDPPVIPEKPGEKVE